MSINCKWYIENIDTGKCYHARRGGVRIYCFSPLAPVKGLGCPEYTDEDRLDITPLSMKDIDWDFVKGRKRICKYDLEEIL